MHSVAVVVVVVGLAAAEPAVVAVVDGPTAGDQMAEWVRSRPEPGIGQKN